MAHLSLSTSQRSVRRMRMRDGTPMGAYFLSEDLPVEIAERDKQLLELVGSPDPNQIDGNGGAHSLRSKVAIVARSKETFIDVDFVFAQVAVDESSVDTSPNRGNILAGVAPLAIERGLVKALDGETVVRVRTLNTGTVADLIIRTPGGIVTYNGQTRIDGVPGTSAASKIDFLDVAGSFSGSLLPTGSERDIVEGLPVTCIDNGVPVVFTAAQPLGRTGDESVDSLHADAEFKAKLEAVRLAAGKLMGLGDVAQKVVPKRTLLAPAQQHRAVATRSYIPHACHTSTGVFGAVSVATAGVLPGTVTEGIAKVPPGNPTGEFTVHLEIEHGTSAPVVKRAGLVRTARKLFDGEVFGKE